MRDPTPPHHFGLVRRLAILIAGVLLGVAGTAVYLVSAAETPPPPLQALPAEAPVSMTFGEAFLSALIRDGLTESDVPAAIEDVRVEAQAGALVVTGTTDVLGKRVPASATLHLQVSGGKLVVDVAQTEFGALPVPLEQALATQINDRIAGLIAQLPATITGARVEPGRGLTVTAQVDVDRINEPRASLR
jgi:hypothetical protein